MATAIEYGLIAALVAVAAVGTVGEFGKASAVHPLPSLTSVTAGMATCECYSADCEQSFVRLNRLSAAIDRVESCETDGDCEAAWDALKAVQKG